MHYSVEIKKKICKIMCLNHCFDPKIKIINEPSYSNYDSLFFDELKKTINDYINCFNNERPQATLNYLTTAQFKNLYYNKED